MTQRIKTVMFEEQKVPEHLSIAETVYDTIMDAGAEGVMFQELYDTIPNAGPRHIRSIVRTYVGQGLVDTEHTCRCGRGTIYTGVTAKKLKTLRRPARNILNNKTIDSKKKKDGKELIGGKRIATKATPKAKRRKA